MPAEHLNIVTGAFSFTGRYICRRLLGRGDAVRTLTGHPRRENPFAEEVPASPFRFDAPAAMAEIMAGADTLYNTYWIRFEQGTTTFAGALANTAALLTAAREAQVGRIVHISSTGADPDSSIPYFRAKGMAEELVRQSGLSHAILRPTLLFAEQSLIFNNLAWLLRKLPVFAVPGSGKYRLQPIHVDDVADLALRAALPGDDLLFDAAGPEIYTFDEMITLLARTLDSHVRLLHVRPRRVLQMSRALGGLVEDEVLTADEITALTDNLLLSAEPPTGTTRFSRWLREHGQGLGAAYFSEQQRHFAAEAPD